MRRGRRVTPEVQVKVYWGITASRSYGKTIPSAESVMLSACGLWRGDRFRRKGLAWSDWVLDSGGFVALNRLGGYPFGPDQYLELIKERRPTWAASMDFPCEPEISRETLMSNEERIDATVDMAVYLCNRDSRVVPVLQGYTLSEYESCWAKLSRLISVKRLAIGSLCKRQSSPEIDSLAAGLTHLLPDIPIHGFGLKLRALTYPHVWRVFSSIDTNAWEYWARGRRRNGIPTSDQQAWQAYALKVSRLQGAPRQMVLDGRSL